MNDADQWACRVLKATIGDEQNIFMVARLTLHSLKSEMKAWGVTAEAPEMLRITLASWHFPALAS